MSCGCKGIAIVTPTPNNCNATYKVCKDKSILIDTFCGTDTVTLGSALHGTVSYSNGKITYIPNIGYVGADSFQYSCGIKTCIITIDVQESEESTHLVELSACCPTLETCELITDPVKKQECLDNINCGCKAGNVTYKWTLPDDQDCIKLHPESSLYACSIKLIVSDIVSDCTDLNKHVSVEVCCGECMDNCCKTSEWTYNPPTYNDGCNPDCSMYPCTQFNPESGNCEYICEKCEKCCYEEVEKCLSMAMTCANTEITAGNVIYSINIASTVNFKPDKVYYGSPASVDALTGVANLALFTELPANTTTSVSTNVNGIFTSGSVSFYEKTEHIDGNVNVLNEINNNYVMFEKETPCGTLRIINRISFANNFSSTSNACNLITLQSTTTSDVAIQNNLYCCIYKLNAYCAECCSTEECKKPYCPNDTVVCAGGECLCVLPDGTTVPAPETGECCPECLDTTVLPPCYICVDNKIVYNGVAPETCLLTNNEIYDYATCTCKCIFGFKKDPITGKCVPESDCRIDGCPKCSQCVQMQNGSWQCVPIDCEVINPNAQEDGEPCCLSLVPCDCDAPQCPINPKTGLPFLCSKNVDTDECFCIDCELLACNNMCDKFEDCICDTQDLCVLNPCASVDCQTNLYDCIQKTDCGCEDRCIPCNTVSCIADVDCPLGCKCNNGVCEDCDTTVEGCYPNLVEFTNDLTLDFICNAGIYTFCYTLAEEPSFNPLLCMPKWEINTTNYENGFYQITNTIFDSNGLRINPISGCFEIDPNVFLGKNYFILRATIGGRQVAYRFDGLKDFDNDGNPEPCSGEYVFDVVGEYCFTGFKLDSTCPNLEINTWLVNGTEYPTNVCSSNKNGVLYTSKKVLGYRCGTQETLTVGATIKLETCIGETPEYSTSCNCSGSKSCNEYTIKFNSNINKSTNIWEISADVLDINGIQGYYDCELLSVLQLPTPYYTNNGGTYPVYYPTRIASECPLNLGERDNYTEPIFPGKEFPLIHSTSGSITANDNEPCGGCGWGYHGAEILDFEGAYLKVHVTDLEYATVCFQTNIAASQSSANNPDCCICNCLQIKDALECDLDVVIENISCAPCSPANGQNCLKDVAFTVSNIDVAGTANVYFNNVLQNAIPIPIPSDGGYLYTFLTDITTTGTVKVIVQTPYCNAEAEIEFPENCNMEVEKYVCEGPIYSEVLEPVDLIFIIDRSGSMTNSLPSVKLDAVTFITNLATISPMSNVGIVQFGSAVLNYGGNTPGASLVPVGANLVALTNYINAITISGATNYEVAINKAMQIFFDYGNTSTNRKVVLFLTDGQPNLISCHDILNPAASLFTSLCNVSGSCGCKFDTPNPAFYASDAECIEIGILGTIKMISLGFNLGVSGLSKLSYLMNLCNGTVYSANTANLGSILADILNGLYISTPGTCVGPIFSSDPRYGSGLLACGGTTCIQSYDCENGNCVHRDDGNGEFPTLQACIDNNCISFKYRCSSEDGCEQCSGGVDCTHNTLADCINACNACSISDINVVCSVAAVGYDLEIYHDNLFCADGTISVIVSDFSNSPVCYHSVLNNVNPLIVNCPNLDPNTPYTVTLNCNNNTYTCDEYQIITPTCTEEEDCQDIVITNPTITDDNPPPPTSDENLYTRTAAQELLFTPTGISSFTTESLTAEEQRLSNIIKTKEVSAYLKDNNIHSVYVGKKQTNGVLTDKLSLVFVVSEKRPINDLKGSTPIPKTILSALTDVRVAKIAEMLGDNGCNDCNGPYPCTGHSHASTPTMTNIYGGVGIYYNSGGTYGFTAIATDAIGNEHIVGVTNNHVLGQYSSPGICGSQTQPTGTVYPVKPVGNSFGKIDNNPIGTAWKNARTTATNNKVDVGIMHLNENFANTITYGLSTGPYEWITEQEFNSVPIGTQIYKSGARTGIVTKFAEITAKTSSLNVKLGCNQIVGFIDCITVHGTNTKHKNDNGYRIASNGDSGSPIFLLINGKLKLLGLLFAGSCEGFNDNPSDQYNPDRIENYAIVCKIWNIAAYYQTNYSITLSPYTDWKKLTETDSCVNITFPNVAPLQDKTLNYTNTSVTTIQTHNIFSTC